jgi:hypothetical protein
VGDGEYADEANALRTLLSAEILAAEMEAGWRMSLEESIAHAGAGG